KASNGCRDQLLNTSKRIICQWKAEVTALWPALPLEHRGDDSKTVHAFARLISCDDPRQNVVRAKLRTPVKRALRKHRYPPDQLESLPIWCFSRQSCCARNWLREISTRGSSGGYRVRPIDDPSLTQRRADHHAVAVTITLS